MQSLHNNLLADRLSPRARAELKGAVVTRPMNRRRGLLKRTCPKPGTVGHIGWLSIMGWLCPARASVWSLMSLSQEDKVLYDEIDQYTSKFRTWINENLQAPMEFNLWHINH